MTRPIDPIASDGGNLARVFRNAGWLFAGRGFNGVLSIVYLAILTRSLGLEGFGTFTIILTTVQAVFAFVTFEAWRIVVRYGSKLITADRREELSALASLCVTIELLGGLVGLAVAAGTLWLFADRYDWPPELLTHAILFAAVLLFSIRSTATGLLKIHNRFRDDAIADTVLPVVRLVGAGAVLLTGAGVSAFLLVWALSELLTTLAFWATVARRAPVRLRPFAWGRFRAFTKQHRGFVRFAVIANLGSTFASANQAVITLVVGFWLGPAAAGLFRIGYQLSLAMAKIAEILNRSLFTEFNRETVQASVHDFYALARQMVLIGVVGGGVVVALAVLAGKQVIGLLAGEDFLPAYPILIFMAAAAAVEMLNIFLQAMLMSRDRATAYLVARGLSLAALLGLLAILMDRYQALGAAASVLGAALVALVLLSILSWRLTRSEAQAA